MAKGNVDVYQSSFKDGVPFLTLYPHTPGGDLPNTLLGKVEVNLWEDLADSLNETLRLWKKAKRQIDGLPDEEIDEIIDSSQQNVISTT